ncbi:carboxymuconolactone decarboxylase family protein [Psychrobacter glacincola]|uniref:carboxymuconolactone decarboxylase family protein n=1 Tax=Psychrobacter glacincola TaxID=56810 RepID=UPI0039AFA5B7
MNKKTKEPIVLALAVGARCDACIGFHTKALVQLGATEEEVAETLGICIYMGGDPSMTYAAEAVASFNEFSKES